MPKKAELNDMESLDILQNEIADYVIGDYCATDLCPIRKECLEENRECIFNLSIERIVKLIHRQEKTIGKLYKEIEENK